MGQSELTPTERLREKIVWDLMNNYHKRSALDQARFILTLVKESFPALAKEKGFVSSEEHQKVIHERDDWKATAEVSQDFELSAKLLGYVKLSDVLGKLCHPKEGEFQTYDWALSRNAIGWLYQMQSNPECATIISKLLKN